MRIALLILTVLPILLPLACQKNYSLATLPAQQATATSTPTNLNGWTSTATPTVTATASPTVTPNPRLYLALGDSVSYGTDASSVSVCFVNLLFQNDGAVYPADAGQDLSTKYPGVQLLNLAIPGATSLNIINNEMPSVPQGALSPNFVTLLIGGNELIDTCSGTPCDGGVFGCTLAQGTAWSYNFKSRLETQIVDVLKNAALYPRVQKIVLANIYDPTDGVGLAGYGWPAGAGVLAQYNARIAEVATDTGSGLVDDFTLFLGHGIEYNNPSNAYYDSASPTFWYTSASPMPIHPDDLGYYQLYKLFWPNF